MSDEELESTNVKDSKTYPQEAGTIRKNDYIVIKGRPCKVPRVNCTDSTLLYIFDDGFVSVLTENCTTKDDLKLPTDEALLTELKAGFEEDKYIVISVMSAMGEEKIIALKEDGTKGGD